MKNLIGKMAYLKFVAKIIDHNNIFYYRWMDGTYVSEIEISKGVSDLETCMEYLQFLEEVLKIKIRTEKPV